MYLLKKNSMSVDDVQIIDTESGAAGAAFVSGKVDAAVTFEPWLSKAKERKDGKVLISSADAPGVIVDTVSVNETYLKNNPENMFIVRQMGNKEAYTGENVIAQNIIGAVSKIEKDLKDNFKIDIKEALITTPIRLDIKTKENWQIYFDLSKDSDVNMQITKLNLLLKGDINADVREKLQYIDLRFKDRAYYK